MKKLLLYAMLSIIYFMLKLASHLWYVYDEGTKTEATAMHIEHMAGSFYSFVGLIREHEREVAHDC